MTTPAPKHGPDGRFLKGVGGNAKGRKPGIIDKRTRITPALAEDAQAIVDVVVAAAKDGDLTACGIVLSRIAPPLKAVADKVQFEYRADVQLSEQAESVMAAVASGAVDAETGKMILGMMQAVGSIHAIEDLESRILQLEAKQIG